MVVGGCRSLVAEHWWLKPEALGSIPGGTTLLSFPLPFQRSTDSDCPDNLYRSSDLGDPVYQAPYAVMMLGFFRNHIISYQRAYIRIIICTYVLPPITLHACLSHSSLSPNTHLALLCHPALTSHFSVKPLMKNNAQNAKTTVETAQNKPGTHISLPATHVLCMYIWPKDIGHIVCGLYKCDMYII